MTSNTVNTPHARVANAGSPGNHLNAAKSPSWLDRLRSTLESYLRGKETAKYLQDQVVSERNGRYVLLVKAEHRSGIPGIVHGTSSTGGTLASVLTVSQNTIVSYIRRP